MIEAKRKLTSDIIDDAPIFLEKYYALFIHSTFIKSLTINPRQALRILPLSQDIIQILRVNKPASVSCFLALIRNKRCFLLTLKYNSEMIIILSRQMSETVQ